MSQYFLSFVFRERGGVVTKSKNIDLLFGIWKYKIAYSGDIGHLKKCLKRSKILNLKKRKVPQKLQKFGGGTCVRVEHSVPRR